MTALAETDIENIYNTFVASKKHYFNYVDDKINHDLHNLQLPEADFDFFMSNQTLEHTYDPVEVARNIYKHLRPNGIVYMNVPAITIPHSTPLHHYTGFTPTGLGCIFKSAGYKILDIGFWGNQQYHDYLFAHNTWPDYRQVTNFSSDISRHVTTWIFAQK